MQGKQNHTEEMTRIWVNILSAVQSQGLSFVLMFAMAFYFHSENKQLRAEQKQCNEAQLKLYQAHSKNMEQVIERNSSAFENFSFYLREQAEK